MRGSSNTMSKSQLLSRISPARPRMQDLVSPNGAVVNCTFNPQLQSQIPVRQIQLTPACRPKLSCYTHLRPGTVVHFLESRDELRFLSRRGIIIGATALSLLPKAALSQTVDDGTVVEGKFLLSPRT